MIKFLVILKIPFVGVISTHKILPGLINVIQNQDETNLTQTCKSKLIQLK